MPPSGVSVYDGKGNFLKTFKNHVAASKYTEVAESTISSIMKGRRKHGRFMFKVPIVTHLQGERWKEFTEDPRYWVSNKQRVVNPAGELKLLAPSSNHVVGIIIKYKVSQAHMYRSMWVNKV